MPHQDVQINNSYPKLLFTESSLQKFFHILYGLPAPYLPPSGELSVVFLDDQSMILLHNDFLNDPTETDVITFPPDPYFDSAGEICVCVDRAISLSNDLNVPFNKELSLYLVHGWLHLIGFNDITEAEIDSMRKAENDIFQILEKASAFPDFHLQ
ncbi:MAG: rRNA maturation RNase YbeY [Verrucomicrobia bacterium]|nr:MAG: rRNA maturation RNase YbeY [Verrucomicrobiota bacterium]